MNKKNLVIFLCLLLAFFPLNNTQKERTININKNDQNKNITINYPKTKYKNLNKKIEEYIKMKYNFFIEDYNNFKSLNKKIEFRTNYNYETINNRYISINLFTYIDTLSNLEKDIKSFNYDKKTKSYLKISDISKNVDNLIIFVNEALKSKYPNINFDNLITIKNVNNFEFSISKKYITVYIPYQNKNFSYLLVKVPITYFHIKRDYE